VGGSICLAADFTLDCDFVSSLGFCAASAVVDLAVPCSVKKRVTDHKEIRRYLLSCRALALFCSQNGWIDDDSISFELLAENGDEVRIAVGFDEVIMKGAGRERQWTLL